MSLYDHTIPQFMKMLRNLDTWLDKGAAHATAKKFEPNLLMSLRLAPDMYPLVKQIQSACDTAKFTAAYMTDTQPPVHPDTEVTLEEGRARIRTCLAYLEGFQPAQFAGAEERRIAPKWLGGKWIRGDHYVIEAALPNFYFHITTAYDILRHNGVDVGKFDFMGSLPAQD